MMKLFSKKPEVPVRHKAKDLDFKFKDDNNLSYYEVGKVMKFPLERNAKRAEIVQWMSSGLTSQELDKLLDVAEAQLEALVQGKKGSLSRVGAVLHEMRTRKDLVIHTDLMLQYIAIHLIREDEDPYTVDLAIMDQKIETFRKMIAGGRLFDFFQLNCISDLNAHMNLSKEEFQTFWDESQTELILLNQKIKFLKSNLNSDWDSMTSTKV